MRRTATRAGPTGPPRTQRVTKKGPPLTTRSRGWPRRHRHRETFAGRPTRRSRPRLTPSSRRAKRPIPDQMPAQPSASPGLWRHPRRRWNRQRKAILQMDCRVAAVRRSQANHSTGSCVRHDYREVNPRALRRQAKRFGASAEWIRLSIFAVAIMFVAARYSYPKASCSICLVYPQHNGSRKLLSHHCCRHDLLILCCHYRRSMLVSLDF